MLPSLEAFGAQETNNAGIPSVMGNIGCFQHEGDMAFPLLECHLLVLGGPVECGQLEYELSCHCAGNRLNIMVLKEMLCTEWWITLGIMVGFG